MRAIEVSLDVFKELTSRLQHDDHSYDDVIRDLLGLDSPLEAEYPVQIPFEPVSEAIARQIGGNGAFYSRGLRLPNGTKLRSRYKQQEYLAEIRDGQLIGADNNSYSSPSAAANAITGNNVNGLRFWEAQRPGDAAWRRLDSLVKTR